MVGKNSSDIQSKAISSFGAVQSAVEMDAGPGIVYYLYTSSILVYYTSILLVYL